MKFLHNWGFSPKTKAFSQSPLSSRRTRRTCYQISADARGPSSIINSMIITIIISMIISIITIGLLLELLLLLLLIIIRLLLDYH